MQYLRALVWALAACSILTAGCASFQPQPLERASFHQRTVSGTDGKVTVTVAALTVSEARDALGVDIASSGIQPVWVKDREPRVDHLPDPPARD